MVAARQQLALPIPPQHPTPPPAQFGLIVDEVKANAVGTGMDWWVPYAFRFEAHGQARMLAGCIAGALMEYGPFERDEVEFMRAHMVENGLPPKSLTVREWLPELPACVDAGRCKRCHRSHGRRTFNPA